MRERTPSADDTPKRAPPAPPREAASVDVAGSKTSSEASKFVPSTSSSSVDARMVASTHNLEDLGVSHPASVSSDRQQQQQQQHGHAYRSAQTAQDKRSRLSNVINNLRKKVPDSRSGDSPRKEEDGRNSVERNLETLEKYVMTVLNGVIKDEEEEDNRKAEVEKNTETEKQSEDQEDEDSKGPAAKFEPSKPNESRTEAAVFLSEQSDKPDEMEACLEQQKVEARPEVSLRNEESSCTKDNVIDGVSKEKESAKVENDENRVKCSSKEANSEKQEAGDNSEENEKRENRSLGTIIMERLSENQTEEKVNVEPAKEDREFENVELRNICRDLLNDLLNGINQLIDESKQEKEEAKTSDSSTEESKSQDQISMTSLHCSLPLDKVASVLQNCQTNETAAAQSPSSSQGSKSPNKPPSPTVRHLCLYCDRKFMSISLRQRHTERVHQQGGGRRSERNSRKPSQNCQYCSDKCAESLESLFQHMVGSHSDKYHGCLQCSTRYLTREALAIHVNETHGASAERIPEKKEPTPCKELGNQSPKEADLEHRAESTLLKPMSQIKDNFSNPGSPEFDSSFYSSVSCNIRENLLHHLDGKLQSSSTVATVVDTKSQQQPQQSFYEHNAIQSIDISLTAATPVYSKEYAEEYENNSEYAQKPGKSCRSHPRRVSFEKYNFPRKYDGKEQWTCSIKDLSKFDISTQLSIRKKQQVLKERLSLNRLHQIPVLGPSETTEIQENQSLSESEQTTSETNTPDMDKMSQTENSDDATEFSVEFGNFLRLRKWDEKMTTEASKKQEVIYAELTGEWSRPRVYVCGACASKHVTLKEMEDHKAASHPNVWCSHFEFSGDQRELYKHLFLPGKDVATAKAKAANLAEKVCTKCSKNCNTLPELHRHMLECGGDQAWLLGLFGNGKKKCKWRPFGSRSRRRRQRGMKRNIQNSQTPRVNPPKEKQPTGPRVRPSDRESIQKMLANLPPKRATRKVLQESTMRTQGRLRNVQTRTRRMVVGDNSSASRMSRNKAALRNKLLKNAKSIQRNRCRIDNISAVIESVVMNYAAEEKMPNDVSSEKNDLEKETKEKSDEPATSANDDEKRTKHRGPRVLGKKRNVKTKENPVRNLDQAKKPAAFKSKIKTLKNTSEASGDSNESAKAKASPKDEKEAKVEEAKPINQAVKNKLVIQTTPRKKRPVDPVASLNASIKAKSQPRTHDGKFAKDPNKDSPSPQKSPEIKSPQPVPKGKLDAGSESSMTRSKLRATRLKNGDQLPKRTTRLSSDSDKMPTLEPAVQASSSAEESETSANDLPILSPVTNSVKAHRGRSTVSRCLNLDGPEKEEGDGAERNGVTEEEKEQKQGKGRRPKEKCMDGVVKEKLKRKSAPGRIEESKKIGEDAKKDKGKLETRSKSRLNNVKSEDDIKIENVPFEVKKLIGSDSKEDLMTTLVLSSRVAASKRCLRQPMSKHRLEERGKVSEKMKMDSGSTSDASTKKEKSDARRKSLRKTDKKFSARYEKIISDDANKMKDGVSEVKATVRKRRSSSLSNYDKSASNSNQLSADSQIKPETDTTVEKRQTRGSLPNSAEEAQSELTELSLKKNTIGKRRGRIKFSTEADKKHEAKNEETDKSSIDCVDNGNSNEKDALLGKIEDKQEKHDKSEEPKASDPPRSNANLNNLQTETGNSMDSGKENSLETPAPPQKGRVGRPRKSWGSRKEKAPKRSLNNVIGILTEGKNIPIETQQNVLTVQTSMENVTPAESPQQPDDSNTKSQHTGKSVKSPESNVLEAANECDELAKEADCVQKVPEEDSRQPEVPEASTQEPSVEDPGKKCQSVESSPKITKEQSPANDIILDLSRRKQKGKGSFLEKIVSKIAKQKDALLEGEVGSLLDSAADELTSILDEVGPGLSEHTKNSGETKNDIPEKIEDCSQEIVKNDEESKVDEKIISKETETPEEVLDNSSIQKGEKVEDIKEGISNKINDDTKLPIAVETSLETQTEAIIDNLKNQEEISSTEAASVSENLTEAPGKNLSEFTEEESVSKDEEAKVKRRSKKRSLEVSSPKSSKRKPVDCEENAVAEVNLIEKSKKVPSINENSLPTKVTAEKNEELAKINYLDDIQEDSCEKSKSNTENNFEQSVNKDANEDENKEVEATVEERSSVSKTSSGKRKSIENLDQEVDPVRRSKRKSIAEEKTGQTVKEGTISKEPETKESSMEEVKGSRRRSSRFQVRSEEKKEIKSDPSFVPTEDRLSKEQNDKRRRTSRRTRNVAHGNDVAQEEGWISDSDEPKPLATEEETKEDRQDTTVEIESKKESVKDGEKDTSFQTQGESLSKEEPPEVVAEKWKEDPILENREELVQNSSTNEIKEPQKPEDTPVVPKVPKKRGRKKKSELMQAISQDNSESKIAADSHLPPRRSLRTSKVIEETERQSKISNDLIASSSLEPFKVPEVTDVLQHTKKRTYKKKSNADDHSDAQNNSTPVESQPSVPECSEDKEKEEHPEIQKDSGNDLSRSSSSASLDLTQTSVTAPLNKKQLSSEDLAAQRAESVDNLSETSCISESSYFRTKRFSKKRKPLRETEADEDSESITTEQDDEKQRNKRKSDSCGSDIETHSKSENAEKRRRSIRRKFDAFYNDDLLDDKLCSLQEQEETRRSRRRRRDVFYGDFVLQQEAWVNDDELKLADRSTPGKPGDAENERAEDKELDENSKEKAVENENEEDQEEESNNDDSTDSKLENVEAKRRSIRRKFDAFYNDDLLDDKLCSLQEQEETRRSRRKRRDIFYGDFALQQESWVNDDQLKLIDRSTPNEPEEKENKSTEDKQTVENSNEKPADDDNEEDQEEESNNEDSTSSKSENLSQTQGEFQTPKKRAAGNYVVVHKKTGEILIVEKKKKLTKEAARFFCQVCATSFTRKSSLKKHNQSQSHLVQMTNSKKDGTFVEDCSINQIEISNDGNPNPDESLNLSMESESSTKDADPPVPEINDKPVHNDPCYDNSLVQDSIDCSQSNRQRILEDQLLDEEICKITENMSHDDYVLTDHVSPEPDSMSTPKIEVHQTEKIDEKKEDKKNLIDEEISLESSELEIPTNPPLIVVEPIVLSPNMNIKIPNLDVPQSDLTKEDALIDSAVLNAKEIGLEDQRSKLHDIEIDALSKELDTEEKTENASSDLKMKNDEETQRERLTLKVTINKDSLEACKENTNNSFRFDYSSTFAKEHQNDNCGGQVEFRNWETDQDLKKPKEQCLEEKVAKTDTSDQEVPTVNDKIEDVQTETIKSARNAKSKREKRSKKHIEEIETIPVNSSKCKDDQDESTKPEVIKEKTPELPSFENDIEAHLKELEKENEQECDDVEIPEAETIKSLEENPSEQLKQVDQVPEEKIVQESESKIDFCSMEDDDASSSSSLADKPLSQLLLERVKEQKSLASFLIDEDPKPEEKSEEQTIDSIVNELNDEKLDMNHLTDNSNGDEELTKELASNEEADEEISKTIEVSDKESKVSSESETNEVFPSLKIVSEETQVKETNIKRKPNSSGRQSSSKKVSRGRKYSSKDRKSRSKKPIRNKIADLTSDSDDSENEDQNESQNKNKIVKCVFGRVFGSEKTDKVKEVLNDWVSKSEDDSTELRASNSNDVKTKEYPEDRNKNTSSTPKKGRPGRKKKSSSLDRTKEKSPAPEYQEEHRSKHKSSNRKKHDEDASNGYYLLSDSDKRRSSRPCKKRAEERISMWFAEVDPWTGKPHAVKDSGYGSFNYDEDSSKLVRSEDDHRTKKRKLSSSGRSKDKNDEENWKDLDKKMKDTEESDRDDSSVKDLSEKEQRLSVDLDYSQSCSSLGSSSVGNRSPSMDRHSQSTKELNIDENEDEDMGHTSPLFVCDSSRSSLGSSTNSENEEEDENVAVNEVPFRKRSSSEFSGEKIVIRSPSSTNKSEVVTTAPTDAIEDNALDVPQEIGTTKPRQGKVLNRDEELFVECCSRLKATTENELRGAKKIKLDHNEGYQRKDEQQQQGFRGPRDRWRDDQTSLGSLLESVNQLLGEEMYSRERDYAKRGGRNLRSEHSSRSASPDTSRADNLGYEDSLDVAFEHNNKLRDKIQQRMRESENLIASTFGQKNEHPSKHEQDVLKNSYSHDHSHLSGANMSNGGYNEALHVRDLQEQRNLDASGLKGKMNTSLGGLFALSNLLHGNEKHDHIGSTPMKVLAELACARAPTSTVEDPVSQDVARDAKASLSKDTILVPNPIIMPKDLQKKSRNPIKELFERKKEVNDRKQLEKSKTEAALRELNVHRQRKTKKTKKHQDFPLIRRNELGGLAEKKKRRDGFDRKEELNRIKDVYEFDEEESQIEPKLGSVLSYRSKSGCEVTCLRTKDVDMAGLMSKTIEDTLENGKASDPLSSRLESMIDRKFKELEKFAPKTKGALKSFQSEDQQRRVTGPMDEFVERKQPKGKKIIEPVKLPKLKKRSKNPKKKTRNAWYENDSSDEYRTVVKTEDVGVGISKSQRTCSKGKQNIFAELYTSSDSEFENEDVESRRQRKRKTVKKTKAELENVNQELVKYSSENEDHDWRSEDLKDPGKHDCDNKKSESEMSDHPLVIDERKDADDQRNSDDETQNQYERNFEMDDLYREDSSESDVEDPIIAEPSMPEEPSARSPNLPQEKSDEKTEYESELIPLEEALDLLDRAENETSLNYNKPENVATITAEPEKQTFEETIEKSPSPVEQEEEPDNDLLSLPEKLSSNEKPQKESENLPLHVFLSRKVQESKKRKEEQLKKLQEEQERILMDLQPTRRQRKCAIGKQGLLAEISSSDEEISPRDRRNSDRFDHEKPKKQKRESKEKRKERYIEKKHEQMIAKEQKAIEEEILREVGKKKESLAKESDEQREYENVETKEDREPMQKKKHQMKEKQKKQNKDEMHDEQINDFEDDCNKSVLMETNHDSESNQESSVKQKKHSKFQTKSKKTPKSEVKITAVARKNKNSGERRNKTESKGSKDKERRSSSAKRDSDDEELKTTKSWNKVEEGVGVAIGRRKRAAANQLYYWSSSSDEEEMMEVVPAVEEEEDDRQEQHGWIVGDSHKRMITMLAMEKQLKEKRRRSEDEFEPGRTKSKKHRNSTS